MATFTEAVRTVEAMAAIPCLHGGFACFDDDLNAVGWYDEPDNLGRIWAEVPTSPAHAERAVRAAVDEHRKGLEDMIGCFEPGGLLYDSRPTAGKREEAQNEYRSLLGRFVALAGAAA